MHTQCRENATLVIFLAKSARGRGRDRYQRRRQFAQPEEIAFQLFFRQECEHPLFNLAGAGSPERDVAKRNRTAAGLLRTEFPDGTRLKIAQTRETMVHKMKVRIVDAEKNAP